MRVSADALAVQGSAKALSNYCDEERPHRRGDRVKEGGRPLGEIGVVHPAGIDHSPIEMFFEHFLECPGDCTLLGRKPAVEIDSVFFLQVPADEGRVCNGLAIVVDIGELAFWSTFEAARVGPVGELCHLQQNLRLGHEGARVREAESRSEAIKRDHLLPSLLERPAQDRGEGGILPPELFAKNPHGYCGLGGTGALRWVARGLPTTVSERALIGGVASHAYLQ